MRRGDTASAGPRAQEPDRPASLRHGVTASAIKWSHVRRVLVVKLRSIGDTVLATPSLIALRRFLPEAQIDIVLEDWVAPVLDGFEPVDNVISVGNRGGNRLRIAIELRRRKYDVAVNMHGGTTATLFVAATRARHRIGFATNQYSFLYNHLLSSANDFWKTETTHSAEQQLALIGFAGVPVDDRPKSRLVVTDEARNSLEAKVSTTCGSGWLNEAPYALFHPTAAFATKQWTTDNFARVAEHLSNKGLTTIAIAAKHETAVLDRLRAESKVSITTFDDLTLPEITALASKARLFVGNDSGIAHMAAAVDTPSVVIFGSSNRNHWRPWTDAPNEIVYEKFPCQPCPGYVCAEFGEPRCILSVKPEAVFMAVDRLLSHPNS